MAEIDAGSGDVVTAAVGDTVVIRLPEATTGHVWSLVDLGSGLVRVGDRYEDRGREEPGHSTDHVFVLRAEQAGEWAVGLRLAREWETRSVDERRLTVQVG
ncbi:protease inhibitor I42 family protein [Kribbella endophytica]